MLNLRFVHALLWVALVAAYSVTGQTPLAALLLVVVAVMLDSLMFEEDV